MVLEKGVADTKVIKLANDILHDVNSVFGIYTGISNALYHYMIKEMEYAFRIGGIEEKAILSNIDYIIESCKRGREEIGLYMSRIRRLLDELKEKARNIVYDEILDEFVKSCNDFIEVVVGHVDKIREELSKIERDIRGVGGTIPAGDVKRITDRVIRIYIDSAQAIPEAYERFCSAFSWLVRDPVPSSGMVGKALGIGLFLLGALVAGLLGGKR